MSGFFEDPALLWLATYFLHASVLLGLAWLLDAAGALKRSGSREFAWKAALLGALLTASVHGIAPGVSMTTLPEISLQSSATNPEAVMDNAERPVTAPVAAIDPGQDPQPATPPAQLSLDPGTALLALWLGIATLLLLRLVNTARLARLELRGRRRLPAGIAHDRLVHLCQLAERETGRKVEVPPLSLARNLAGPVTLPNGEICLPEWATDALDGEQLDAMLAHELGHVLRRDAPWLLLVTIMETVFFFQPLNRLAHRRLAAFAELNADAFALRLTGGRRALAEALTHCASRLHDRPQTTHAVQFGAAMATRRSSLVQRVERLLKGIAMNDHHASRRARLAAITAVLGALLLLPALGTHPVSAAGGISITHNSNSQEMRFEIGRPGYFLHVETDGEVHFTADETDIESLARGARLLVREKRDGLLRELHVTNTDGELVREFSRAGKSVPLDDDARAWLARVIPEVLRNTAIDAGRRVERLLAEGGIGAVLDEIERIEPDFAQARYTELLVEAGSLDNAQLERLFAALAAMGSDFELRRVLSHIVTRQSLAPSAQALLLETAGTIGSDFEAAELLMHVTPNLAFEAPVLDAWRGIAGTIGSDFEMRRALAAVFDHRSLPPAWKAAAMAVARQGIGSDFEMRSFLEKASATVDGDMLGHYLAALETVGSDFEAREAVVALARNAELDANGYATVLDALGSIGSDFECRQALEAIAATMPREPGLLEKYRGVAATLSGHEREQAERALR